MSIDTPISQENLDHARSLANAGCLDDMYEYTALLGERCVLLAKDVRNV